MGSDFSPVGGGGFTEAWLYGLRQISARGTPKRIRGQVISGAGGLLRSMLTEDEGATAYQVPVGKTLVITRVFARTNAANAVWYFESATTAIGLNQVGGGVGVRGEDNPRADEGNPLVLLAANTAYDFDYYVEIAASRFPNMRVIPVTTTVSLYCLGVEV